MNADERRKEETRFLGENGFLKNESEIVCPFCKSTNTEMISLFGMQLMTTQHYCRNCHSAFEAVKWEEETPNSQNPNSKNPISNSQSPR